MLSDTIRRQIRRCNRNLLLVNCAIILVALISLYESQHYLYNCYAGPQHISASDILRADRFLESRYFVSISDLNPVDAGLEDTETSHGNTRVTTHYFAAPVENRLLLIKSSSEKMATHYNGALLPVSASVRASFQREILDARHMTFSQVFVPYMLDARSFRSDDYIGLAIGIPIILLAAFSVKKALVRIRDVRESPIYKWLRHHDSSPEIISAMIESDLKLGKSMKMGSLTFTSSWLLNKTWFGFTTCNLAEVVWVYKKITRHSVNFIPTGKSHGLIPADKSGRMIEIDVGRGKSQEDQVSGFIQALAVRIPWVVVGYSDELKKLYKNNRADFVSFIDQRHAQYFSTGAAAT